MPEAGQTPARLVLLGAPGVGKGTQADLLTKSLRACHLSTGDVFRAAAGGRDCQPSPAMKEALDYMRQGALVPDSTVWEMVRERGACLRCGGGFILDGFPRTVGQAESLKNWMDGEGITLTAVVSYDLPENQIVSRLGGRQTCEKCKAVFHLIFCSGPQCRGTSFSVETPSPCGPRNAGQSAAWAVAQSTIERMARMTIDFIERLPEGLLEFALYREG